jgi:ATP-dependent DNA helicase RecG
MTKEELKVIIQQGEGYNIEFKQDMPSKLRELGEEICAFANAAGGTLLVGVKDNNTIKGVVINNTIRSRVQEAISLIQPRLEVKVTEHQIENKVILCLICKSGNQKPYTISGNIFVRNGPNSEKITSVEQMRDFFQQADRIYFDEAICKNFLYPKDFDQTYFKEFLKLANITTKLPETILLENLKLYANEKAIKNGAVLFFAKDVQHFFDHAIIRCIMFKGNNKRYIIDDKKITGNLYYQYEEALKYIISKLNLSYDIESQGGGPRKEILEIPEVVFKEALVNALAHRDYYEKGANIMVEIFDDRVEISNPGGLVNSISRNEFGTRSFSRNPLVFGLFERTDLVEKVGSGINRMRDAMLEANLPEPEFKIEGMFTVIFNRPMTFDKWLDLWKSTLNETRLKILTLIYENNNITKLQLAKTFKISTTAIDNNLKYLKEIGILERIGSDKKGKWRVVLKKL